MDEARAVLARLDRIEALDRRQAHPAVILAELRALVGEAERWAARDADEGGIAAVRDCGGALERASDHQERGSSPAPWRPIAPLG